MVGAEAEAVVEAAVAMVAEALIENPNSPASSRAFRWPACRRTALSL